MIEREDEYDVVINAKNELMICIKVRADQPANPKIMYDGGDHALLIRAKPNPAADKLQPMILLDFIAPEIQEQLKTASRVLVLEVDRIRQLIHNGYSVVVQHVKALPVPQHELDALADYKEKMRDYVAEQEALKLQEKANQLQAQAKPSDVSST